MIHHSVCPACKSAEISIRFTTEDFSVTKEKFSVFACANCGLLFTQDIPAQDEMAKYYQAEQYISHSDTSKGIINKLYHFVRKRTLISKRKLIIGVAGLKQGSILDIGSGTGAFLKTMQDAGWNIAGIEPDEIARANSEKTHRIRPLKPSGSKDLPTEEFDAITMWHVLEHIHDLDGQMNELHRLLKQSGKIFIAVPNYTSYDAKYYGAHWAAWDVPRHLYHFSPDSMEKLCRQHGFSITSIKPMWFDSFYVSMLSEQYKSGKSNVIKGGIIGLISNLKALFNKKKCSSLIYILEKTK